jgi:hypothetical protein
MDRSDRAAAQRLYDAAVVLPRVDLSAHLRRDADSQPLELSRLLDGPGQGLLAVHGQALTQSPARDRRVRVVRGRNHNAVEIRDLLQ